ncbi:MAG: matrixin family metalloprotease [Candidatus Moranbacteria bacterium]|nr:matrixin family metalloprotease [Candidatus Moranbacteria bacterium]
MKTKYVFAAVVLCGALAVSSFASAEKVRVVAHVNPSGKSVVIPERAIEVAPHVFSLGETMDAQSGKMVEGYLIVHKKDEKEKPANPGTAKDKTQDPLDSCYSFIVKGAKWRSVEPWVVNPTNPFGISDESVFSILDSGISNWEDAMDGRVDGIQGGDAIGTGSMTHDVLIADTASTDGLNEVYFGNLDEGTIGVTIVWGYFSVSPKSREIVEWDQVYNTFYDWSDNGDAMAMDFENIATHELGHSFGMGDLYDTVCRDVTMYGYGTEGETKKSTLERGDINGIKALYQ